MRGEDDPRSHAQEVSSPLHEAGTAKGPGRPHKMRHSGHLRECAPCPRSSYADVC